MYKPQNLKQRERERERDRQTGRQAETDRQETDRGRPRDKR